MQEETERALLEKDTQIADQKRKIMSLNIQMADLKVVNSEAKELNEKYLNKINELLRYQLSRAQDDLKLMPHQSSDAGSPTKELKVASAQVTELKIKNDRLQEQLTISRQLNWN